MPPVAFAIVPGSQTTPGLYEPNVLALLRQRGHTAVLLPLPSSNDGTVFPAPSLAEDAASVRAGLVALLDGTSTDASTTNNQEPRDVVVLMHSYGGIAGSAAVEGLCRGSSSRSNTNSNTNKTNPAAETRTTAVIGIVYMAAFLARRGESVRSLLGPALLDAYGEPYKSGVPGGYLPLADASMGGALLNDLARDPARRHEVARYQAMMTRQASDAYGAPATYEPWREGVECVVVIPGADLIIPTAVQERMYRNAVASAGAAGARESRMRRVLVDGASHGINISQPEIIVAEMLKMAGLE